MYWFAIKRLLISHYYLGFGDLVEDLMADAYSYPNPVHTCFAAWAYRMDRINGGWQYSCEHPAPTMQDPDFCYELEDPEMEDLIIQHRLYPKIGKG